MRRFLRMTGAEAGGGRTGVWAASRARARLQKWSAWPLESRVAAMLTRPDGLTRRSGLRRSSRRSWSIGIWRARSSKACRSLVARCSVMRMDVELDELKVGEEEE